MPLTGEEDKTKAVSRTSIPGRGNMCKGPEIEKSSECSRNRKPVGSNVSGKG